MHVHFDILHILWFTVVVVAGIHIMQIASAWGANHGVPGSKAVGAFFTIPG